MNRSILNRMKKLELRLVEKKKRPPFLLLLTSMSNEQREALKPNERIVHDWFKDVAGFITARERVTTDPDDDGERCARNGQLEHVIREMDEERKSRKRTLHPDCH